MITPTHMLFGLALAYILRLPRLPALLAGLALDLDVIFNALGLGFPFIHRGIIHTPVVVLAVTAVWYYGRNRSRNALSAGVGGLSHLLLDFFTNQGIMALYPFAAFFALPMVDYANVSANTGIILLSAAFVLLYRYRPKMFGEKVKDSWQRMLFIFIIFIILAMLILYASSLFFP